MASLPLPVERIRPISKEPGASRSSGEASLMSEMRGTGSQTRRVVMVLAVCELSVRTTCSSMLKKHALGLRSLQLELLQTGKELFNHLKKRSSYSKYVLLSLF